MAQLAPAWTIGRPGITCMLAGARNARQLQENVQAASVRLAPDLIAELDEITRPLKEKLGPNADYCESAVNSRMCQGGYQLSAISYQPLALSLRVPHGSSEPCALAETDTA